MPETVVYLQVEPEWSPYRDSEGNPRLSGIKVVRFTLNPPQRIGGVAFKLKLRIPDSAFLPLRPAITIEVPEAALEYEPVVTVELSDDGGSDG